MASVVPLSLILDVNGLQHETTIWALHTGSLGDGTDQWLLDVPTACWLLERVAAGDISTIEVTNLLRQAARWNSGCCYWCDLAAPSYPEALRRYRQMLTAWKDEQDRITPLSHPFLLDNSRVHAWDCADADSPRGPGHPGLDLHSYTAWHGPLHGDLDRIMATLQEETLITRRITTGELIEWLRQRNPSATDPRCPACVPPLPEVWP